MQANHTQPHYAPSSVGGLMDPGFLRDARIDADGGHRGHRGHIDATIPRFRWRLAMLAVTGLFKRH